MIYTHLKILTLTISIFSISAASANASISKQLPYHTIPTQEKVVLDKMPVISVRFNNEEQRINYKEMLHKVVKKVATIKKGTRYDIVSIVPIKDGDQKSTKIKEASDNTRKMFFALKDAGIAPEQIAVHYQENTQAHNNEIHVFIH